MNAKQLIAHFDRIGEAPDAVGQLRRLVRGLAERGMLVGQDPSDTPVPVLLEELGAAPIDPGPFQIPSHWSWVRLGSISEKRLGKMLDREKNKGTPRRYLRNVNVRWFDFDLSDVHEMPFEDTELEEFRLHQGDVMVCEGGEPGRAAVWDEREPDVFFQKAIHRVRFPKGVEPPYFVNILRAAADDGRLMSSFTGVAIKHLTGKGLATFLVPLPPVEEQRRIVGKVDELMALCAELEDAQIDREQRRDRVATSSQRRMVEATADPATFRTSAKFYLERLPRLATRPEHITELRRTILDLALQGQLTERSADTGVKPWLAELRKENSKFGVGLKRRRGGAGDEPPDPPYGLPQGWAWIQFGAVHELVRGVSYSGSDASKTPVMGHLPLLRANNIGSTLNFNNLVFVREERVGAEQRLRRGDYLLALSSGSRNLVGKAAFVPDDYEAAFGAFCGVVRLVSSDLVPYVGLFLASSLYREAIAASSRGIGINNLKREALNSLAFPLPPLEEQKRIVAKVDELMALCDQLEDQLGLGAARRSRLLEAVLYEALHSAA